MKRLILFELMILFLATTFESDSPPGWYQQVLPVNDQVNDIFFLDSSTGWVVTNSSLNSSDSGYIMKTTDGGSSWNIQLKGIVSFNVIQFVDDNTGYAGAVDPVMKIYRTVNGGNNWGVVSLLLTGLTDMYFVNSTTGWYCDPTSFGGLYKTTNGGVNWQQQLNQSYQPLKLFFMNNDTGWAGSANWKLYRTTNSGLNWNLQFTFAQQINDIHFFNRFIGIVASGFSYRTTDGGFNWVQTNDGGIELSFTNDTIGYAGADRNKIIKTTNGGSNWYRQTSPIFDNSSICGINTLTAWAGGTGLVRTSDGGGPPLGILYASSEVSSFNLDQNFPNPFNPTTIIIFKLLERSTVELLVYNILGEEVAEMVDDDHFTAGVYQFGFDASKYSLPSGIYFYRLTAKSEISDNVFTDTKKMVLLK